MVRDVVLKIGEAQEQLEKFLVIVRIAVQFGFGKGMNRIRRISQQPCQRFFVHKLRFHAPCAHVIRAFGHHLDKMIEAHTLASQRRKDLLPAPINVATPSHRVLPSTPMPPEGLKYCRNHTPNSVKGCSLCAWEATSNVGRYACVQKNGEPVKHSPARRQIDSLNTLKTRARGTFRVSAI